MTQWSVDLRVGGRWSVAVRPVDGGTLLSNGEFELDVPRKVVLTRKYEFDSPQLGRRETTVTYRLDPIPTGTRVTVRHEGFAGVDEAADYHAEGWVRVLRWLVAYLTPGSATAVASQSRKVPSSSLERSPFGLRARSVLALCDALREETPFRFVPPTSAPSR